jgi:large-conductance mechanosensitive channel
MIYIYQLIENVGQVEVLGKLNFVLISITLFMQICIMENLWKNKKKEPNKNEPS